MYGCDDKCSSFLKERERERCGIRCPTPLRALRAQQNQFMKGKNDLSGLLPLLLLVFQSRCHIEKRFDTTFRGSRDDFGVNDSDFPVYTHRQNIDIRRFICISFFYFIRTCVELKICV